MTLQSPPNPQIPKIAAIVPMRAESERLPGKNTKLFQGAPLYDRIVRTLLACPSISTVAVDTDSDAILDRCATVFPEVVRIERPANLRGGCVPMHDVLSHSITCVPAEVYVQTHCTNPLLRAATVERAIAAFVNARDTHDALFSVTRLQTRLYDAAHQPINHDPATLARTQDLPPVFEENSNLYLFTADTLRTTGRRTGARPLLFAIDRLEAVDIDDEAGWHVAEALAAMEATAQ